MHCNVCKHTWDVVMRLPMPFERALKVMKGAVAGGCPQCGAFGRHVICGAAPVAELGLPFDAATDPEAR